MAVRIASKAYSRPSTCADEGNGVLAGGRVTVHQPGATSVFELLGCLPSN